MVNLIGPEHLCRLVGNGQMSSLQGDDEARGTQMAAKSWELHLECHQPKWIGFGFGFGIGISGRGSWFLILGAPGRGF